MEDDERIGGGRGRNFGVVVSEDDEESPSKKQRGAAQDAHDKENEPRQGCRGSPSQRRAHHLAQLLPRRGALAQRRCDARQ